MGHFRFVGELFNCGVIRTDTVLEIIAWLLRIAVPENKHAGVDRNRLEALCMLLETSGPSLEREPATRELVRQTSCFDTLEALIQEENADHRTLSFRFKFMILDLLEFRSAGWKSTSILQKRRKLAATTLEQIRREAAGKENGNSDGQGRKNGGKQGRRRKIRFQADPRRFEGRRDPG